MKIAVVVGNPKAQSRTYRTAEAVAKRIDPDASLVSVDLADHAGRLFAWPDEVVDGLLAEVAGSDVLVVASPTYKATYTGLLKAFLDRYGNDGLAGVVAVPVMTGAADGHALAVEAYLRPLLVELGATVPSRGLYMTMPRIDELDSIVDKWGTTAVPLITAAVAARV